MKASRPPSPGVLEPAEAAIEDFADAVSETVSAQVLPALMDSLLQTRSAEPFLARAPLVMLAAFGQPGEAPQAHEEGHARLRAVGVWMARALWDATPLPWAGFERRPLPKPARNDACPCGSGKKFKRCCLRTLPRLPEVDPASATALLLTRLGKADRERARRQGPAELRYELALRELDAEHPGSAKTLLLELLEAPRLDTALACSAVQALTECYRTLGQHRAGIERLGAFLEARSRPLRSAAHESIAVLELDSGHPDQARAAVRRALREDPENLLAGLLDIELDIDAGAHERVRAALEHWRPIAAERASPVLDSLLAELEAKAAAAADEAHGAPTHVADGAREVAEAWSAVLEPAFARPLAALRREAGPEEDGGAPSLILSLPDDVEVAERARQELERAHAGTGGPGPEALRHWLAAHPAGLQSPEFLGELLHLPLPITLQVELVAYRERLLAHWLDPVPTGTRLPWGWLEHRPLLRLLLDSALEAEAADDGPAAIARLERLLALDPDDAQGARLVLVNRLLREGDDAAALARIEAEGNRNFPEMAFGAVLALARTGRVRDAEAAFRAAHARLPKVLGHLRRARRPPASLEPGRVTVGGEDQAWYYGEDMRDLFRAEAGLIAFMDRLARQIKAGR